MNTQPYRVCDYTVGCVYMWRKMFKTEYCIIADMLVFRIIGMNGKRLYVFPVGDGDVCAVVDALYADNNGEALVFVDIPEAAKDTLVAHYGDRVSVREWRDSADYLYNYETFLSFPGRHLSGKRNHGGYESQ